MVVAIVSDTTDLRCDLSHLVGCLEALGQQVDAPPMEVIVPYYRGMEGIEAIQQQFPVVRFVCSDRPIALNPGGGTREHHDELRADGLAVARGELWALVEDHARPDRHWCAALVRAHRQPYAAVGGAIENGIDRLLNWAVYFCDFGRYQNPVFEGESFFASDANVAYKRAALDAIRPVWNAKFQETAVNSALMARGEKLALSPHAVVYQHRKGLRVHAALKERFIWGRSYAASRSGLVGTAKRLVYGALSPVLPALLLLRMTKTVLKKRRCVSAFVRAFPLTALLIVSWSLGEFVGYCTARARRDATMDAALGAQTDGLS